jgi:hypothetical protein
VVDESNVQTPDGSGAESEDGARSSASAADKLASLRWSGDVCSPPPSLNSSPGSQRRARYSEEPGTKLDAWQSVCDGTENEHRGTLMTVHRLENGLLLARAGVGQQEWPEEVCAYRQLKRNACDLAFISNIDADRKHESAKDQSSAKGKVPA